MTFIPTAPFGVGGNVTANISTTVADFGATNFPNSPNFASGKTSTRVYEQTANAGNQGTVTPPSSRP